MKNFFSNFVLRAFKADTPRAQAQIEILDGELHDDVEVLDYYGIASSPPDDIEHGVCAHIHGQDDNSVVLGFIDDKHRPTDLKRGEVVFYASFGQTIKFSADGSIKIDNGNGSKIEMVGGAVNIISSTLTHNGTNVGDTHVHPQNGGNHFGGGVDTSSPH